MIRIFTYFVFLVVVTWVITLVLDLTGYAVIELQGQRLDVPTSTLLLVIGAGLLFVFFGGNITAWLWGLPGRMSRRAGERKRAKGMTALTRGLEAVAAGDADDATRHAKTATKALDEPALTRLLTAQAAQLSGDRVTAEESYAAMLEAPETEFLGLRGLYLHAKQNGDRAEAQAFAERAFQLRPGTSWAFESVLSLSLDNAAWSDALNAINSARQHQIADGLEFRRMEAAILTARAYSANDADEPDEAIKDLEGALKKAGTLTPAAALAAEVHVAKGQRSKAAKVLGDAWELEPHPGLAEVMRRVFDQERDERVQGRLIKLTEKNPDHPESRLLLAQVQLEGGDAAAAQETLEPLLTGRPQRRVLSLMAEITESRYGPTEAKKWKQRAASAPLDIIPGMDGVFHYTTEGWRRLIQEFSEFERLAPPPLEIETPELGSDEVKALLAPPPEPDPEPELAEETEDAVEVTEEVTNEESETDNTADETAGEAESGNDEDAKKTA
ncbi:MAG: tetratricopeptide repeat protein [Parvularculaceae bacterium]|nr:tetratricopeptide repeat protein [Parvularculaceae bacterium]